MSIVTLLDEIRDDMRTMPGITRLYDEVPDALNEFPAVIVAAMGGSTWLATHNGSLHWQHDVRVEVHVPRTDLAANAAAMTALARDAVPWLYSGFVYDRYNGTLLTTGNPESGAAPALVYTINPSEWGGKQTYAFMCDFTVTTQEVLG